MHAKRIRVCQHAACGDYVASLSYLRVVYSSGRLSHFARHHPVPIRLRPRVEVANLYLDTELPHLKRHAVYAAHELRRRQR